MVKADGNIGFMEILIIIVVIITITITINIIIVIITVIIIRDRNIEFMETLLLKWKFYLAFKFNS